MTTHTDSALSSHRTRSNLRVERPPQPPQPAPQQPTLIRRRSAHLPLD